MNAEVDRPKLKDKRAIQQMRLASMLLLVSVLYCAGIVLGLPFARSDRLIFYPLVFLYNYSSWFIAIFSVLALLSLIVARLVRRFVAWPIGLGLFILCMGSVFLWSFYYEELDTVQLNDHVYHLGLTSGKAFDYTYTLCECDEADLMCRCHAFYWTKGGYYHKSPPHLIADSGANEVTVRVDGVTIYRYDKQPQCYTLLEVYGGCIRSD